jgi:hypothetical protein
MNKLINSIKRLWSKLFPKKDGYFYKLKTNGELVRESLTTETPVLVENVPDDYLSDNYEEDFAEVECPYNVASLKLLHKKDLEDIAMDCGILITKKTRKAQLVKEIADYFGI